MLNVLSQDVSDVILHDQYLYTIMAVEFNEEYFYSVIGKEHFNSAVQRKYAVGPRVKWSVSGRMKNIHFHFLLVPFDNDLSIS